jgi:polar amino acid transport system substrate-binding protein
MNLPKISTLLGDRLATTLLTMAMLVPACSHAHSLSDIKARGTLIVGVKKDVPLWGYQDPKTGVISGMEIDLAQDLADRIGVKLEVVGLRSAERTDAIQSGRVDVLIATLSDTPDRRKQMTMVMPHYYSSGVSLLARKVEKFHDWAQLKNRKICGIRGSLYTRPVTVKYGADIVSFHSRDWATQAVRDGRCSALIFDSTGIVTLLQNPEWSESFEMPLTTIFVTPWSIAIPKAEAGGPLDNIISSAIIAWHREGHLARIEQNWKIPTTDFVRNLRAVWNKKSPDGKWYCGTAVSPATPPECL